PRPRDVGRPRRRGAARAHPVLRGDVLAGDAERTLLMGAPRFTSAVARWAQSLVFDKSGPLTSQLAREPGRVGLGQGPRRLMPDRTASMICGFCSTGCWLDVHLKGGQAVNVSPSVDYSVNRGTACPKGWEALAPLRAADRGTTPLVRNEAGKLVAV